LNDVEESKRYLARLRFPVTNFFVVILAMASFADPPDFREENAAISGSREPITEAEDPDDSRHVLKESRRGSSNRRQHRHRKAAVSQHRMTTIEGMDAVHEYALHNDDDYKNLTEAERQMRDEEISFYSNSENEHGDDNIWGLLSGVGGNIYEW
jgi:hypothetical protein